MHYRHLIVAGFAVLLLVLGGCAIEESDRGITGAVNVTLSDDTGAPLNGARISVNGSETAQFTPAVIGGLRPGTYTLSAFLPGFLNAEATVHVAYNDTVIAPLTTAVAPPAAIELTGAPDSTILLLNNIPFGMTPPALFPNIGVGTYRVSMYLSGHGTDLPAQWSTTLALGDTFRIPANFTAIPTGSEVGQLAPVFVLPNDWDTSHYRLQDYRGQIILLTFFYLDCAPCVAEMPYIQAVYSDPAYAGKIQFFGIDPQDPYSAFRLFRTVQHPELGLTFPLLSAFQQGVREAYAVPQFPTNIIVDQTGKIYRRFAGVNENDLRDAINTLLAQAETF